MLYILQVNINTKINRTSGKWEPNPHYLAYKTVSSGRKAYISALESGSIMQGSPAYNIQSSICSKNVHDNHHQDHRMSQNLSDEHESTTVAVTQDLSEREITESTPLMAYARLRVGSEVVTSPSSK